MSGILKIHSNASDGGIFGHSWIEYCPIDGHPVTYGTWGNHPEGGANGLRENLEAGQCGDYCRAAMFSTPARLARAIAEVNANDSRGTKPFSD